MRDIPDRGHDRPVGPHHHFPYFNQFALSIERPGGRRMRGLGGRHGRPSDPWEGGPGGPDHGSDHGDHARPRRRGRSGRPDAETLRRHAHEHRHERGPHFARRGAVREAVLRTLGDEPMHGYQLMQAFAERTGGRWRPSAGSIYPTLQQLEDEGLIAADDVDGRKVFHLTDAGAAAVAALPDERIWSGRGDGGRDLRGLSRELGMAALQVGRMGSPAAVEAAAAILTTARRDLYRLLADDPATDAATAASIDPRPTAVDDETTRTAED